MQHRVPRGVHEKFSWMKGTEWMWNKWREVGFFVLGPTQFCGAPCARTCLKIPLGTNTKSTGALSEDLPSSSDWFPRCCRHLSILPPPHTHTTSAPGPPARQVRFEPDGTFDAPTTSCAQRQCKWSADETQVYIQWGSDGVHWIQPKGKEAKAGNSLSGKREDGEKCSATFIRKVCPQCLMDHGWR